MRYILFFIILIIPVSLFSAEDEPPVGWCTFYPIHAVGADVIGKSGASVLSVIQSGWGIWSNEDKIDFGPMDAQLELAKKTGLKLALISETNPVYSPAWMNERAKSAGQNTIGSGGSDGGVPTFSSPIFRQAQDKLIREVINHVKDADKDDIIKYYHPGCEWWFPHRYRYNELEINHFREWLRKKYGIISSLNRRWESDYKAFKDVPAPRIDSIQASDTEMYRIISSDVGQEHCSWSLGSSTAADASPDLIASVKPDTTYIISAMVKTQDVNGPGVFLEVAWVSPAGGPSISGGSSGYLNGTNDWTRMEFKIKSHKNAGRAWILLKTAATGTVYFDDISIREAGSNAELIPNGSFEIGSEMPKAWSFQNWTAGSNVKESYLSDKGIDNSKCVSVTIQPLESSFKNLDAATYDWSSFWYEYAGKYINDLSGIYKKYDPETPTVSYLTFSFGYPAEWDYSQQMSIAPEEVASKGYNIDAIGMQVCAADGDPYRATAALDLVRKYKKPMWAVDLVDFTSGVYIGYDKMNKITQSVIQHGADGIIYCLWNLPGVEDYSFYPNWDVSVSNKMLTDAKDSIKLMNGFNIQPDIALVQPIMPASSNDKDGFKNDFKSFIGWYKILEKLQITFDVITLSEIEKKSADLNNYKIVVVPDCAYMTKKTLSKFIQYSGSGRTLISGGRFAEFDGSARMLSQKFVSTCKSEKMRDYGKEYSGNLIRGTHAGNTPPLYLWGNDTPDRLKIFNTAYSDMKKIIDITYTDSITDLYPRNDSVRSMIYKNNHETAYYLVNMGDDICKDMSIKVKDPLMIDVVIYADNKEVPEENLIYERIPGMSYNNIRLPDFNTSCIVFIK